MLYSLVDMICVYFARLTPRPHIRISRNNSKNSQRAVALTWQIKPRATDLLAASLLLIETAPMPGAPTQLQAPSPAHSSISDLDPDTEVSGGHRIEWAIR